MFIFTVVALSGAINLRAASVSFPAFVAVGTGVLSWTLVLLHRRLPRLAARAAGPYLALIAWMFATAVIDGSTRQGVQFITVQGAFVGALLLASIARRVSGDHLDVVVANVFDSLPTVIIGSQIAGAADAGLKVTSRGFAIVALIGMGWYLAEYRSGNRTSLLWSLAVLLGSRSHSHGQHCLQASRLFLITMFMAPHKRIRNVLLSVLGHRGRRLGRHFLGSATRPLRPRGREPLCCWYRCQRRGPNSGVDRIVVGGAK